MYNDLEAKAKHALLQIAEDQLLNTGNFKQLPLDLSRNNSSRRSRVRSLLSDDILFNNMHLLNNGVSKSKQKESSPRDSRKNNHFSEKTTPRQSDQLKSLISSRNQNPQVDFVKSTQQDNHKGFAAKKRNSKETNLTPKITCNINIYSTSITSWNTTSKRNNTNDHQTSKGFLFPGQKEEKRGTIRESVFIKSDKPLGESFIKKQEIDFSKMTSKLNSNLEENISQINLKQNNNKNNVTLSNETNNLTQRNEISKHFVDCFQSGFLQFKYQNQESSSKPTENETTEIKQKINIPKQQSEVKITSSISPKLKKEKNTDEQISTREQKQKLSKKLNQNDASFDDSNIKSELQSNNKTEVTSRKPSQIDEYSMKDRILHLITSKRRRSELQLEFKQQQLQYQQSKLQQQQSQKIITPKVLQDLHKELTPQPTITTAEPTPRSLGNTAKTPDKQVSPFFLSQIPSPSLCVSRYQPSPIGSNLHQFHHSLRRNRHHKLRFQMVSNSQQQQQQQQQPTPSITKLSTNPQDSQVSQQLQELEISLQQAYEQMQKQYTNKEKNNSEIFPCLKQIFQKVSRSVDQKCPSELSDYKKRSEKPPQRARSRVSSYLENKSSPLESILQSSRQLDGGSPLQQLLLRQSQHQHPVLTLGSPTNQNSAVILTQQLQKPNRSLEPSSGMAPLIQVTPILLSHPLNQIILQPQSTTNNNSQSNNSTNNFSKVNHFCLPSISPTSNIHKAIVSQSPKLKQFCNNFESSLSPKLPIVKQKISAI